ncbi:MAG TPA: FGGY family carbohydrate kinase, partial [Acidimicrobiia bacterium]|nr:FGGY family carbohydrate kinase [Acidimicrobiia bacterium]
MLGIDIGTTRIKAVVIDAFGVEHAAGSVATPFAASVHGVDMEVADLEQVLARILSAVGPARDQLTAVGIAGLAESGAPLRERRPVGPIIAWHDGRGEDTVASLEARFGPSLPRWTGRKVRTVSSLAKLGWLIDQGITAPDRWLGVPELALFLFTGTEATEHSLAARTGAYDVTRRHFLPEVTDHVLAGTGCDPDRLFPAVRAAGEAMGFVSAEAAARYGIPSGIAVTIAGHDHLAAAAGLGGGLDDLFNSVGTAETVFRRTGSPPDIDRALALDLAVTLWPGGTSWGILASAARAGVVLGELAAALGRSAAELDRLAESESVAARQWSAAISDLVARTVEAGARVAELAGPHRRLVVFGGGSRSALWLAAKARAAGVPVLRSTV